jgi:hypothetical protein
MSDRLLDELARSLGEAGVHGASARRVLAEARVHLEQAARAGDPDPAQSFGDPREIARLVAAELATSGTRRATFWAFAALALTGLVYLGAFALVPAAGGWQDISGNRIDPFGPALAIALVVLPQIAFVAGCLALLGALRQRGADVVPEANLRLVRRRSVVAIAAGLATLGALALFAVDATGELSPWWTESTLAASSLLALPLAAALATVLRAGSVSSPTEGSAGDVFEDLAPVFRLPLARALAFPVHPWRFALCTAAFVGVLGLAGGWYAEGDPGSGLVRGGFEAVALVICFAALGRVLGLRRTTS